jgi:acylphosphatase
MTKVEVEILPDGQVKVHVLGVSGPSCMKLTQALEQELGRVEKTVKTTEYYQVPTVNQQKRTVTQ